MVTLKLYTNEKGSNASGFYPDAKKYYFGGFYKGRPCISKHPELAKKYKRHQDGKRAANRLWNDRLFSISESIVKIKIS